MKPDTDLLDPAQEAILDMRIGELRRGMHEVSAPATLEGVLAARLREAHSRGRRPSLWWMPPLALAATLAIVSWTIRGVSAPPPAAATPATEAEGEPFLALRPLERIALEPGTTVVATEFPRALLAEWGLPVSPDRAGEPVRAEMLYSPSGEALAVRLVN